MSNKFRMMYASHIKKRERKQRAESRRLPSVFNFDGEDPHPSGKSFSKKEIAKRAEELAERKGWKVLFAEKVVRREIARLKMAHYRVPVGAFRNGTFTIKGYVVKYREIKAPFGDRMLWRWRAYECSCPAGSRGHRCWHQDYCDYVKDGLTTIPQKYGMFHRDNLLRIRSQQKDKSRYRNLKRRKVG